MIRTAVLHIDNGIEKEDAFMHLTERKVRSQNEFEEIANVTYHRLDALMADGMIEVALQNEVWELVEVLVMVLKVGCDIPSEKVRKYANGIMEFAMIMYFSKLADFPEEDEKGKYRHCNDIIKLWMAGKDILVNAQ